MERFDVIMVGAGTGECMAAKTKASAGLNVCLVHRKARDEIGSRVFAANSRVSPLSTWLGAELIEKGF